MGAAPGPPHLHWTCLDVAFCIQSTNSLFFFIWPNFGGNGSQNGWHGSILDETAIKTDQYGCRNKLKWATGRHSSASYGLVREKNNNKREGRRRWEDTKKWLELRRGEEEEEQRFITKYYKLSRWESQLFHVGGLGNWKMIKGTFLEGDFLFKITKNIDFIKNKS